MGHVIMSVLKAEGSKAKEVGKDRFVGTREVPSY